MIGKRRFAKTFLLLLLLLSALPAWAGDTDTSFQQCNGLASKGENTKAIACYKELIREDGYAPGVLFNLGNSYSQTGQVGNAILSYERALRLSPGDSDLSTNLQQVRKEHGLFAPQKTTVQKILHILSLRQWSLLALAAGILFTLACCSILVSRNSRRGARSLAAVNLLILLSAVVGILFHLKVYNPSVVMASDGQLLISPFQGAQPLGSLQEGRLVFVEKQHGSFVRIHDRSGRTGWVKAEAVEPVCPSITQ